jgi:AraC family transcriptional regulator
MRLEAWPAFVISGVKSTFPVSESFSRIPKIWQGAALDGTMDSLYALWSRADQRPAGILGITSKHLDDEGMMDYFLAVTTFVDAPDAALTGFPEDLESFKFPAVSWAVFEANGALPAAMSQCYRQFTQDWLPTSGFIAAPLPVVECYLAENRQEVWFPVVAKG